MNRSEIESTMANVIDKESVVGLRWWPGKEMASIAYRRWSTFTRRHKKARCMTNEDRILDLAKGMQAHFEPDFAYTPLNEWLHLAHKLADVITSADAHLDGKAR